MASGVARRRAHIKQSEDVELSAAMLGRTRAGSHHVVIDLYKVCDIERTSDDGSTDDERP